ncbi:hypothetical protein [Streptosporangium sp. H16]|uniref:hypothetical protein n=1 Tax=Streptosporangium sp. H16 TaxID=3444184 RepID=UPI003F79DDA3
MAPKPKITKEIGPWPGEELPAQWREPQSVRDAYDITLVREGGPIMTRVRSAGLVLVLTLVLPLTACGDPFAESFGEKAPETPACSAGVTSPSPGPDPVPADSYIPGDAPC